MLDSFLIATKERGETLQFVEVTTTFNRQLPVKREITEDDLLKAAGRCNDCMRAEQFEQVVAEAIEKYSQVDEIQEITTNPKPILPVRSSENTPVDYVFKPNLLSDSPIDTPLNNEEEIQDSQERTTGEK